MPLLMKAHLKLRLYRSLETRAFSTTANQDVHALTQTSRSILPIYPFNLQLETDALHFWNSYVLGYKKKVQVSW